MEIYSSVTEISVTDELIRCRASSNQIDLDRFILNHLTSGIESEHFLVQGSFFSKDTIYTHGSEPLEIGIEIAYSPIVSHPHLYNGFWPSGNDRMLSAKYRVESGEARKRAGLAKLIGPSTMYEYIITEISKTDEVVN